MKLHKHGFSPLRLVSIGILIGALGASASTPSVDDESGLEASFDTGSDAALFYGGPESVSSAPDLPHLSISNGTTEVVIQWPLLASDWRLEQSSRLSLPWTRVSM